MRRGSRRYGLLRRATQVAFALFYLALPLVNAVGLRTIAGTPASTRIGPVDLLEPATALSAILAGGLASPVGALLLGAAPVALVALLLGPVSCSWACPFGLVSELVDRALSTLRRRPWRPGEHERLRVPRVAFLAAMLGGSALLALPLAAILQGPRTVAIVGLEGLYLGSASLAGAGLLGALLLAEAFLPRRLFCRALCPSGAIANFLRTRRTLRVGLDPVRCDCAGAPACLAACAWGIDPRRARRFDGCTNCLACVDACHASALAPTSRLLRIAASPSAPSPLPHRGRDPMKGRSERDSLVQPTGGTRNAPNGPRRGYDGYSEDALPGAGAQPEDMETGLVSGRPEGAHDGSRRSRRRELPVAGWKVTPDR